MKCKAFKSVFRNRWVWIIREHGHTLYALVCPCQESNLCSDWTMFAWE